MIAQAAFPHAQPHHDQPLPFARRALQAGVLRLLRFSPALALAAVLLALPTSGFSQITQPMTSASAPVLGKPPVAASVKAAPSAARPSWPELSASQQKALAPLAFSWHTLSEAQKRKWLEISKNYTSLAPEGQAVMHSRMNEWVALSPQQRAQARLNFGKTKELSKELTPEEKKAKWQTYQALSAEEKQKLAAKASPKPAGAAIALKPVAPQKLAAVPPHSSASHARSAPKMVPSQPATAPNSSVPRAGEFSNGAPGTAPQR